MDLDYEPDLVLAARYRNFPDKHIPVAPVGEIPRDRAFDGGTRRLIENFRLNPPETTNSAFAATFHV